MGDRFFEMITTDVKSTHHLVMSNENDINQLDWNHSHPPQRIIVNRMVYVCQTTTRNTNTALPRIYDALNDDTYLVHILLSSINDNSLFHIVLLFTSLLKCHFFLARLDHYLSRLPVFGRCGWSMAILGEYIECLDHTWRDMMHLYVKHREPLLICIHIYDVAVLELLHHGTFANIVSTRSVFV